MLILLIAGCFSASEPPPTITVTETPAPVAAPAELAKAPSVDVFGLKIGQSTDAEMQAWVAARSLTCPGGPSVRRTTYRYGCTGDIPQTALAERPTSGKISEILLVRGDATPLSHVSSIRTHAVPASAADDYDATAKAIVAVYGAPARGETTVDRTKIDGQLVHYVAEWHYTDLDIVIGLDKLGGDNLQVTEQWDLPGAEDSEQARPSTGGDPHHHGGGDPGGHGGDPGGHGGDPGGHGGDPGGHGAADPSASPANNPAHP